MAYTKNSWQTGDTVTAEKLNHAEDGIETANQNALPAVTSDDNGDVLTVVEGVWAKAAPSGAGVLVINAVYDETNDYATIDTTAQVIYDALTSKIPVIAFYIGGGFTFELFMLQTFNYADGDGEICLTKVDSTGNGYAILFNFNALSDYPVENMGN